MSKPTIIGLYPVKKDGVLVAIVNIFRNQQDVCRRRAILVGKAIADAEGDEYENATGEEIEPSRPFTEMGII